MKPYFFQPLFPSFGDRTVRMVGGVWRPQPHGGEFSTFMADLRRRAVAPVGSVRGPLCALRQRRARSDGRKGARWPRFAIVAVLTAHERTDVTIFRALEMRAGCSACRCLAWVCAVRRSRMRSTGKNQRARRPLAPPPSRFERSRASLDLLQMPTASARLLSPSCGLVAWVSQGRAMLQVRRAAPRW